MRFVIDANVFLELILGQERGDECRKFLNWLSDRSEGIAASFTIHAVEAIAGKTEAGRKSLRTFFELLAQSDFEVYTTSLEEEEMILDITERQGLDFDDGLHYFISKKFGAILVSFDKDFDHTDIKRLTPREALLRYT
ncbi:MAG: PilT domain-containing protein [Parcubacteria group bacterium Gr01-1014_33]|nr:MAG: PilT domain-containing protein [Parcubacteria group bacterium Gr01-1014_33]